MQPDRGSLSQVQCVGIVHHSLSTATWTRFIALKAPSSDIGSQADGILASRTDVILVQPPNRRNETCQPEKCFARGIPLSPRNPEESQREFVMPELQVFTKQEKGGTHEHMGACKDSILNHQCCSECLRDEIYVPASAQLDQTLSRCLGACYT